MRSPLLALLPVVFAMVLAPTAPVYTVRKEAVDRKETVAKKEAVDKDAPKDKPASAKPDKRKDKKQKNERAPVRTHWCELTPVFLTGDGPTPDDSEPELCPELAPALSARRLPVVLRFPEPPTEPDRVSLRSGHLALPPPVA